jgi:hypothetical protein
MKLRDLFEAMDLYKYHSNPEKLHGYDKKHMATPEMAYEALKSGKLNAQQKKEAESVVAKDPEFACWYARDVIKGRFPKGEPAIAKDPEWAYWYACNVIKGRFPKGESAIAKDPEWACWYARSVIKGRFPEAEPAIAKHPKWTKKYKEFIKGISK